jgi:hypothetical protein
VFLGGIFGFIWTICVKTMGDIFFMGESVYVIFINVLGVYINMPISHNILKSDVRVYFEKYVNIGSKILDIGAGVGTYSKLLRDMGYKMDCMEVWLPYVVEYKLNELYDNVIIGNVMNYDICNYDVIIMGDILEHLSVQESLVLMDVIERNKQLCLVAVPYQLEQGEYYGNVYEIHKQSDLTNDVMLSRYSNLNLLFKSNCYQYGYYINRGGYYNNDMQCYVDDINNVSDRLHINKIQNKFVEYVNDGGSVIDVRLDIYDGINLIYAHNISMESKVHYWSSVNNDSGNKLKYVFSGEGINKVYIC